MSHARATPQGGADDARSIEEHHITGPHREDEIEAIDGPRTPLVPPPAGASPPHRPHGLQLHMVDGGGVAHRHRSDRLSIPVVMVT
jgi:hypothetical protein